MLSATHPQALSFPSPRNPAACQNSLPELRNSHLRALLAKLSLSELSGAWNDKNPFEFQFPSKNAVTGCGNLPIRLPTLIPLPIPNPTPNPTPNPVKIPSKPCTSSRQSVPWQWEMGRMNLSGHSPPTGIEEPHPSTAIRQTLFDTHSSTERVRHSPPTRKEETHPSTEIR